MSNTKMLTIAEVSKIIDVSPRTIRKVLRATFEKDAQPGKGGRWAIRANDVEKLRAKCDDYVAKSATVAEFD